MDRTERGTDTFAALRFPAYRRLWFSGLAVFMAVNGQTVARGWLARDITGSNAGLGGVFLGFGIAMLLATPFGGVAADRLPKRAIIAAAQLLIGLSSLWIGLAVQFDFVEYWMLIVASALQALAFAFYGPARVAFTAELVEGGDVSNAIVLVQVSAESMRIIGPTMAGAMIGAATWGLASVFLASAALCTLGAMISLTVPHGKPAANREPRSPLAELRDGLHYVRHRRDLSLLVACSLGVVIVGWPYMAFMPTIADGIFSEGSTGYGLLSAASALGAVTAGLLVASRGNRHEPWKLATVGGMGLGGCLILLAVTPVFVSAMLVVVAAGASMLMFQTTVNSLLLGLSDFEYHGRIQSLVMLGFSGFGIVALPIGLLADTIGLRATLALMGATIIGIMSVFAARRRRYRTIELLSDLG